jgi:DKNYY family
MKKLKYTLFALLSLIILFFPFVNIGENYYRGILGVWHKDKSVSTGNFIKLFPDFTIYSPIFLADPTSFHYIDEGYAADRFYLYLHGERIPNFDGNSFRSLGNGCYVDNNNARCGSSLILKKMSPGSNPESFDSKSFQGNIFFRYEQEGNTNVYKKIDNYRTEAIVTEDNTGIFMRTQFGGALEIINGSESNYLFILNFKMLMWRLLRLDPFTHVNGTNLRKSAFM